jgi:release factor glutamine methyltransferase
MALVTTRAPPGAGQAPWYVRRMEREQALVALGRALHERGYQFVTVTPSTHRRVNERDGRGEHGLRDIFGWNRPFPRHALLPPLLELLCAGGALIEESHGLVRSAVRFSSLGGHLFVHSAYPTREPSSVFFGPDTYRFCASIARARIRARRAVDVGCGSGAGGVIAGRAADRVVLADVNDEALVFSRVNAVLSGLDAVEVVRSDVLAQVDGPFDFVLANPPYMRDELHRTYRDGGGQFGEGISLRIVREAIERLSPGGTLLLYTGVPVVDGRDMFRQAAAPMLQQAAMAFDYEEVDPDVFGDELDGPNYATVERIAAVVLRATRPAG